VSDLLEARVPHEAELDTTVSELLEQVGGLSEAATELVLHAGVEVDLHDARTVSAEAPAAADDVSGEDEVVEDGLVDGGGSAGALNILEFVDVLRALDDLALSDKEDVFSGEALLKFGDKGLLGLADEHEEAERIEDENALLAGGRVFEFLGGVDVEAGKALAERLVSELKLEDGLSDVVLNGGGLRALELTELTEVRLVRHFFQSFL
jgi:hypothetical protein